MVPLGALLLQEVLNASAAFIVHNVQFCLVS